MARKIRFLGAIDDALYFGVLLSLLVRWAVSRWSYSGAGKPPMYGDYEAQRHWMEITVNLPMKEWYRNSSSNDLLYWGLDYPPLTAYQSLLFGYLAQWINPDWVALNKSRGYESYDHKIFMRSSVIITDVLVFYVPAILYWLTISRPKKPRDKAIAASLTLLYPGLILIDHGHFQYNCVSLGFTLWALVLMMWRYDVLGAFSFTLAIHYKQMSLYFALPFFCYLLGTCFRLPWKSGAFATLLAVMPSCVHLFKNPSTHTLRLALVNSSLVFFLFSYQVHEKSILLAALPVVLLIEDYPLICTWFVYISTFSLVPLLAKDGLIIPFFSLTGLFLIGVLRAYDVLALLKDPKERVKVIAFCLSIVGCIALIVAMFTVKPHTQYPHLHILLNCVYSCFHFVGFAGYFHYQQYVERPWKLYIPKVKYA